MHSPIWVIAVEIVLVLVNCEVDGLDTVSNKVESKEQGKNNDIVPLRHLNANREAKLEVAGMGDIGVGHGHGHLHHPNKVSPLFLHSTIHLISIARIS